jgi:hypothetical protein
MVNSKARLVKMDKDVKMDKGREVCGTCLLACSC